MEYFSAFDDELFINQKNINLKKEINLKKIEEIEKNNLITDLLKNNKNINHIQSILKTNPFIFSWRNAKNESILYLALKHQKVEDYYDLIFSLIMSDHNNELECISNRNGKTCLMLALEKNIDIIYHIYFKYDINIYHQDNKNRTLFSYVFSKGIFGSLDVKENLSMYMVIQNLINRYLESKNKDDGNYVYEFKHKKYNDILKVLMNQNKDELNKHIDFQNFFDFIQIDFNDKQDLKTFIQFILDGDENIFVDKVYSELVKQNAKIDLKDIDEDAKSWFSYLYDNSTGMEEKDYLKIFESNCLINTMEDFETMSDYEISNEDDEDYDEEDETNNNVSILKFVKNIINDIGEMNDNEYFDLLKYYVNNIILTHPYLNKILENMYFTNSFRAPQSIEIFMEFLDKVKDNKNVKPFITTTFFEFTLDYIFEINLNENNSRDVNRNELKTKFNENLVHKMLDYIEYQYNIQNKDKKSINLSCPSSKSCRCNTYYFYCFDDDGDFDNKETKTCRKHISHESLQQIFYSLKTLNYESAFRRLLQYQFNFENYFELLTMIKDNNRFLSIFVNMKKVRLHIQTFLKKSDKIDGLKNVKCEDECIVCFEQMENSYIECSKCKQKTHSKCALEWLKRNSNCMYCRTSMTPLKNKIQNIEKKVFYEDLNKLII